MICHYVFCKHNTLYLRPALWHDQTGLPASTENPVCHTVPQGLDDKSKTLIAQ